MKSKGVVINLTPINETSSLINPSIAMFIAETLGLPAVYKEDDIRAIDAEVVIVVNGLGQFCKARAAIGDAIAKCKKFIWVMNDYFVQFPRPHSQGSSEILDGVKRGMLRGMEFSYWATVPKVLTTPTSRYVNWNAVAHHPERADRTFNWEKQAERRIIYYGSMRPGRLKTFDHFFGDGSVPVTVSSQERAHPNWLARFPNLQLVPALLRPLEPALKRYAMGLYLQEECRFYESPANRFYEMLGAGIPIIFQPEAQARLNPDEPGLPNLMIYDSWVAEGPGDYERLLRKRVQIRDEQQAIWARINHRNVLRSRLKTIWAELLNRPNSCARTAQARLKLISGG